MFGVNRTTNARPREFATATMANGPERKNSHMDFASLGLSEKVLKAVEATGYKEPTPIQAQAIPHVLERKDILGIAQTGTGKTASFVLPMLTILEKGRARTRMPRTLILEPTRELAAQVEEDFHRYGVNHKKLNVALLIGGVSFDEQNKRLDRGADVLIATPGRLLDHFERGRLLMTGVEILVIDEADRMLDMGFIPDIERISKLIPFTRQTLFFSATMPPEIQRLVDQFLQNPVSVEVSQRATPAATVTQKLVRSGSAAFEKRETLRGLIRSAENLNNAIVFCNRKRDVAIVARSLERHGFNAGALHGDMDQRARMAMLDSFKNGNLTILVASDVAARGLDLPAVSHVYNFDVPTHADDYVHRIGRTGRAGRTGEAFTIVTKPDGKYVSSIEKLIDRKLDWVDGDALPKEEESGGRRKRHADKDDRANKGDRADSSNRPRRDDRKKPAAVAAESEENPREERRSKRGQKPRENRKRERDDDDRTGFRDHVPAFLLRPVRAKHSSPT